MPSKMLMGKKVGMTQVFNEAGKIVPVTVIEAGPCLVSQIKTTATDGYDAVQIGFGTIKPVNLVKPQAGHFAKAGVVPCRYLREMRTADVGQFQVGQELKAGSAIQVKVLLIYSRNRLKVWVNGLNSILLNQFVKDQERLVKASIGSKVS